MMYLHRDVCTSPGGAMGENTSGEAGWEGTVLVQTELQGGTRQAEG